MRIYSIVKESIVDGPGLRTAIFFQGCTHGCPGCHNPESHDFNGGEEYSLEELIKIIDDDKLSTGVTFSGGDPLDQFRSSHCGLDLILLASAVRARGLNLGMYTGYTIDQMYDLIHSPLHSQLFAHLNWVVTEPFIESKKSIECAFRGSTNQQVYRPEFAHSPDDSPRFVNITDYWDTSIF